MTPMLLRFRVPRARRRTWRARWPFMVGLTRFGGRVGGAYVRVGAYCVGFCFGPRRVGAR